MTPKQRTSLTAAILAVGLCAAGCGRRPSEARATAEPAARGAATTAPESKPPRRNACTLFDREDVEQIVGKKLFALHNIEATDQTACELSTKESPDPIVIVRVYWKGGKELVRSELAALSMAKQMLNDSDVDIEELTGSGRVRGLADKAYYSDVMPSWVLKDDVLIQVIMPTFSHDWSRKTFSVVAKKALSRLPTVG